MNTLETTLTERMLIHEFLPETSRIRSDVQMRANMLQKIFSYKQMSNVDINTMTSPTIVSEFVFQHHLIVNREMMKQYKAGKKNVQDDYILPRDLEELKYALLAWVNLRGNKYEFLANNDGWTIDEDALESYFVTHKVKVYAEGEQLDRYRRIEQLITLLREFNVPWNHINGSSALSKIIEANGREMKPRWQAFAENY